MLLYNGSELSLERERPIHVRDVSSMTEQAGYVDAKTQITRLQMAGVNLVNYRRSLYEYPDGVVPEDASPDPTLDVGFDMADADMIVSKLDSKLKTAASSKKTQTVQKEGVKGETSPESGVPSDVSK